MVGRNKGNIIIAPKHFHLLNHFQVNVTNDIHRLKAKEVRVRAGSTKDFIGGVTQQVKKIIIHEEYYKDHLYNVALLILTKEFHFGDLIKKIPLADIEPEAGNLARVSGWGFTKVTFLIFDLFGKRRTFFEISMTFLAYIRETFSPSERKSYDHQFTKMSSNGLARADRHDLRWRLLERKDALRRRRRRTFDIRQKTYRDCVVGRLR